MEKGDKYNNLQNDPSISVCLTVFHGLQDAAITLFCAYHHKTGRGGLGFASNSSKEMDATREEIKQHCCKKMVWSSDFYDALIDKIVEDRHQRLAHYDGSKADYQEGKGYAMYKSPGSALLYDEFLLFRSLVDHSYEYVTMKLFPNAKPALEQNDSVLIELRVLSERMGIGVYS